MDLIFGKLDKYDTVIIISCRCLTLYVAGGLGFIGVWYCIYPPSTGGITNVLIIPILIGYEFFWAFFMIGVAFRVKALYDSCGFLKDPMWKSLFYIM